MWYFVFRSTMAGEFLQAAYPFDYGYDKIHLEWMSDGKHVIRVGEWSGKGKFPTFRQTHKARNDTLRID